MHCYGAHTFHTQRFEYFKSYKLSVKAKYSFHPAAGVCLSSPVDTFYVLGSDKELFGLTHTSLVFAPARGRWVAFHHFINLPLLSDGRLSSLITAPCWPTPTSHSCPWACTPGTSWRRQIAAIGVSYLEHMIYEMSGNFCFQGASAAPHRAPARPLLLWGRDLHQLGAGL